ncbi:predicted protein [Nematostella vectensis]|uniref:protein-serine/threonine phosphatase n=1 Tax=Nematostella vectensis TaxID=45351 RepID=A7RMT6_NEMVE|nr:dual specificity protein phosphatase 14 [Nematostella vectensis]EDO47156.1 predicted protein [Nematostella vectensis]|eukprot:XP_001639219.1 predicted protein [Nematostella vectensis]
MYRSRELKAAVHHSPLTAMARITEWLFLSSCQVARDEKLLLEKGITLVINATIEAPEQDYKKVKHIRIKVNDNPGNKIGIFFDMVSDKIESVRRVGGKVLVHCIAGVSRSASLVIAYLMKYQRLNLRDAHKLVQDKRPLIRPNTGFWKELIDYEKKLFGKNSVQMVDTKLGPVPDVYYEHVKDLVW